MKGLDFLIYFLRLDSENSLILLIGRRIPTDNMNKWKSEREEENRPELLLCDIVSDLLILGSKTLEFRQHPLCLCKNSGSVNHTGPAAAFLWETIQFRREQTRSLENLVQVPDWYIQAPWVSWIPWYSRHLFVKSYIWAVYSRGSYVKMFKRDYLKMFSHNLSSSAPNHEVLI